MNRTVRTLLVALLVVGGTLATGVGPAAATAGSTATTTAFDDGSALNETADEAYVTEEGDVVLLYRNETTNPDTEAEIGLSVSRSVFHALVVTQDNADRNVTGNATAILEPDRFAASGDVVAPRPAAVDSLSMQLAGEQSDQNAYVDASLDATVDASGTDAGSNVSAASAAGEVMVTPDTFAATAEFGADLEQSRGDAAAHSFALTETPDGYFLEAGHNFTVNESDVGQWNSTENANATLSAQYGVVADALNGSADVMIESHQWDDSTNRVDVTYNVTYSGIDEGLEDTVTRSLSQAENLDMTEAQARSVAESVTDVTIDDVSASFRQNDSRVDAAFGATLSNYEPVVRSALTVAENINASDSDADLESAIESVRTRLNARQNASLEERFSFDVQVATPDADTVTVSSTANYSTTNWAAYRDELRDRGVTPASTAFDVTAETDGDLIRAQGSIEISHENLLKRAANSVIANGSLSADEQRFVDALRNASLKKAQVDVDVDANSVTVEGAAAFEDLAGLRDAIRASEDGFDLKVASVVATDNDTESAVYVRASGAVRSGANESEVRELRQVDENTTLHMPGEYDQSTLPEPNGDRAYDYLNLSDQSNTDTPVQDTREVDQPGFGFLVGLVGAAVLVTIVGLRRRD
jgi:hypothetical protein